jgi:cyanuric acid amidohydrolase
VQRVDVHVIPTAAPDDVTGLDALIRAGTVDPAHVICLLGKTEGNGCVNDFSRGFATRAFKTLLAQALGRPETEVGARVLFIMSGGTEGVMAPHMTVFTRRESPGAVGAPGLVAGIARTRALAPEELGTLVQVTEVERAVRDAMASASIGGADDVHFVQIKCPLLTAEAIGEAERRGRKVATSSTYASMGYSRGASALGVALALGEVARGAVADGAVCRRWDLYSRVASTSAGVELDHCEVLVLGNAPSASTLVIGHDVMEDAIDAAAVRRALAGAGWRPEAAAGSAGSVVGVFAKAEASPSGRIRGRRHTMIDDSDINHTRHARAAVAAVVASVIGDPLVYVSGGAEHQGPSGGGPVAAIVRRGG